VRDLAQVCLKATARAQGRQTRPEDVPPGPVDRLEHAERLQGCDEPMHRALAHIELARELRDPERLVRETDRLDQPERFEDCGHARRVLTACAIELGGNPRRVTGWTVLWWEHSPRDLRLLDRSLSTGAARAQLATEVPFLSPPGMRVWEQGRLLGHAKDPTKL